MQIDTDHVLFWMDAIRNSDNPTRTLESFWKGQINSKIWCLESIKPHITHPVSIDICGGWNGVMASLIFQSDIPVVFIRSIDIDPGCESTATTMNKIEEMQGRFKAETADMCDTVYDADVVFNTSCEHITQAQYETWLAKVPDQSLLVLQSNDYDIPEHVRLSCDLDDFQQQCGVDVLWKGQLQLPLYNRFMIIGRKNV
jgi:hypothetical protein